MLRRVFSVIAGMATTVILIEILFLIIMALAPDAFPDPEAFPPEAWVGYTILGFGALIAIIAGYLTGLIAKREPFKHGLAFAGGTLILGSVSFVMQSDIYPLWYAVAQPALGLAGILIGAKIREMQIKPSAAG